MGARRTKTWERKLESCQVGEESFAIYLEINA